MSQVDLVSPTNLVLWTSATSIYSYFISLFSVLNVSPEDPTAAHCKVVCLLQTSKFQEAVQFIERYKLSNLVFEKAYAEYRLNVPDKALKTIDSANLPSPLPPNIKELRAQVLYRLERFEECFDVYRDIIKNTDDDYDDERTTNLSAVVANLAFEGTVMTFFKFLKNFIDSSFFSYFCWHKIYF